MKYLPWKSHVFYFNSSPKYQTFGIFIELIPKFSKCLEFGIKTPFFIWKMCETASLFSNFPIKNSKRFVSQNFFLTTWKFVIYKWMNCSSELLQTIYIFFFRIELDRMHELIWYFCSLQLAITSSLNTLDKIHYYVKTKTCLNCFIQTASFYRMYSYFIFFS